MFTVISILIIAEAFSGNLVNAECREYGFHKWVSESIGGNYGLEYIEVTTPKNKEHYMLGRNFDNSIFLCEQLCLRDSTCVGINLSPVVDPGHVRYCITMGPGKARTIPLEFIKGYKSQGYKSRGKYCLPIPNTVVVKTKNERVAGTDAQITLTIEGEHGSTKETVLDGSGDDFEQGDENAFTIMRNDLGDVKSIKLWRNTEHLGNNWKCEWVKITAGGKEYKFNVNQWIKPNEYTTIYAQ